jgi:hypothetical protein
MMASSNPNRILRNSNPKSPSCDNATPPLKPIAKSRYKEINRELLDGMSRSLLICIAKTPRIKNSNAGLRRFSVRALRFTGSFCCFNC